MRDATGLQCLLFLISRGLVTVHGCAVPSLSLPGIDDALRFRAVFNDFHAGVVENPSGVESSTGLVPASVSCTAVVYCLIL